MNRSRNVDALRYQKIVLTIPQLGDIFTQSFVSLMGDTVGKGLKDPCPDVARSAKKNPFFLQMALSRSSTGVRSSYFDTNPIRYMRKLG